MKNSKYINITTGMQRSHQKLISFFLIVFRQLTPIHPVSRGQPTFSVKGQNVVDQDFQALQSLS
jgi:hypothetical protein